MKAVVPLAALTMLGAGYYNMVSTIGIGSVIETGASVVRIVAPP